MTVRGGGHWRWVDTQGLIVGAKLHSATVQRRAAVPAGLEGIQEELPGWSTSGSIRGHWEREGMD